jgi:signal transduction histidine kinase
MSHEIRTPLNAINGFTQLLCDPEFELSDEEKLDMQKRVTSNTEASTIIINALLELAAGESGTLDLNDLSPVNINDVCRKAKKEAEEHNENNLQIVFTTEIGDDFTIKSNEETILQILNKITNNAQKFTKEGSVILHASRHDSTLEISVTDTGIGIPEDKQKSVFDNFVKLDEFSEGVGLGLSISIRLARSLGGDISIDPTYKTGSRFILQLPIC